MKEKKVYTIVYFKDGKYFMISANCFPTRRIAENVAKGFCEDHNDGSVWSFDIEKLGCYE